MILINSAALWISSEGAGLPRGDSKVLEYMSATTAPHAARDGMNDASSGHMLLILVGTTPVLNMSNASRRCERTAALSADGC